MKNKKNIYFLIPAVLFIWGVIGYRIVKTVNPSSPKNVSVEIIETFKPQTMQEMESYALRVNYRDPFLGTIVTVKPNSKKRVIAIPKVQIVFPVIVYKGMIAPQNKKKLPVFLIQINGQQYVLKLKAEEQGISIISGNNKTVVLEYKKQRQSFEIQN